MLKGCAATAPDSWRGDPTKTGWSTRDDVWHKQLPLDPAWCRGVPARAASLRRGEARTGEMATGLNKPLMRSAEVVEVEAVAETNAGPVAETLAGGTH